MATRLIEFMPNFGQRSVAQLMVEWKLILRSHVMIIIIFSLCFQYQYVPSIYQLFNHTLSQVFYEGMKKKRNR